MGRVPEYQRRQLVSAYVGDRTVDRSGTILAEGVQKFTSSVSSALYERQRQINIAEADLHIVKFKDRVREIQVKAQYSATIDPESDLFSVGKQIRAQIDKEAKGIAQSIRNRSVRRMFTQAAQGMAVDSTTSTRDWAYRTQGVRGIEKFKSSIITRASAMGQIDSPQGVKEALDEMRQRIDADQLTSPDSKERMWNTYSAKGVKDHFLMQLERNPSGLIRRLVDGEYRDLQPYLAPGGTEALIKEAQQRIAAQETIRIASDIPAHIDVYRQLIDLGDAPTAVMHAEAEYERLMLEKAAAERDQAEFPADKEAAMKGYQAVMKYGFNMDARLGKNSNPVMYEQLEQKVDALRASLQSKPKDKDLNRQVLDLQAELIEAQGEGHLSPKGRVALEARLMKAMKGRRDQVVFSRSRAAEYASQSAFFTWNKNPQDEAYPRIRKQVDKFFKPGTLEHQTALENAYQQFNSELEQGDEFMKGKEAIERANTILNSGKNKAGEERIGLLDRLESQYRGYSLREGSIHPDILKKVTKLANGEVMIEVSDAEFARIMGNQ